MKRHVYASTRGSDRLVAAFELKGDRIVATYHDPTWERELELIYGRGLDTYTPADGADYLDALDRMFANSTRVTVTR